MATEDFSTYSTRGAQIADVTITAGKCDCNLTEQDSAGVYDDKGAAHFGTDWEHDFEVTPQAVDAVDGVFLMFVYAVSNVLEDSQYWWDNNSQAIGVDFAGTASTLRLRMTENEGSINRDIVNAGDLSVSTKYYLTCYRHELIEVTSSTRLDVAINEQDEVWLYSDEGVDNFGAAFTHTFDVKHIGKQAIHGTYRCGCWAIANSLNDQDGWAGASADALSVSWAGASTLLRIEDLFDGDIDASIALSEQTQYYPKVVRYGADGVSIKCEIYDDSGRTSLVDTVTLTTRDATTVSYRYIIPAVSRDEAAGGNGTAVYIVENLNLGAGVVDFTTYTGGGGDDGKTQVYAGIWSDSGRATPLGIRGIPIAAARAGNPWYYYAQQN
jgi:hypothetical protein